MSKLLPTTTLSFLTAPALAHTGHGDLDGGAAWWPLLAIAAFAAVAVAIRAARSRQPPADDG